MRFEARAEHARYFTTQKIACNPKGDEELAQQQEGSFLKTFVQFIKTNFLPIGLPEIALKECVDSMNQHGHDQFAVEFAQ